VLKQLRPALTLLVLLTAVTGLAYPLTVTGIAQLLLPRQANGSLVIRQGLVAGSELIGQEFQDPRHFWGRPSATAAFPYNAQASGGSNLGPSSLDLVEAVKERVERLHTADPDNPLPIPIDLVTSSGSGLDPHISLEAALYQAPRVARARGMGEEEVKDLVRRLAEGRQLGILGEPRVNVLYLNLALDGVQ
jgi:K+-transporting ATPase ATPase C chain